MNEGYIEHLSGPILILIVLFAYVFALSDKWFQLRAAESRGLRDPERQQAQSSNGATPQRLVTPNYAATNGRAPVVPHEATRSQQSAKTSQAAAPLRSFPLISA